MILSKIRKKKFKLFVSPVHITEIKAIPDEIERIRLKTILESLGYEANIDLFKARLRAEEFVSYGFGIADAAHVAFAEECGAEFITCDDRLIKKCKRYGVKVWSDSPIIFCLKENLR